jgi:hypothetical protein
MKEVESGCGGGFGLIRHGRIAATGRRLFVIAFGHENLAFVLPQLDAVKGEFMPFREF